MASKKSDWFGEVSIVNSIILKSDGGSKLVLWNRIFIGRFDIGRATKKTNALDLFVFLNVSSFPTLLFGVGVRRGAVGVDA